MTAFSTAQTFEDIWGMFQDLKVPEAKDDEGVTEEEVEEMIGKFDEDDTDDEAPDLAAFYLAGRGITTEELRDKFKELLEGIYLEFYGYEPTAYYCGLKSYSLRDLPLFDLAYIQLFS